MSRKERTAGRAEIGANRRKDLSHSLEKKKKISAGKCLLSKHPFLFVVTDKPF